MESTCLCRLCKAEVAVTHSSALFSKAAITQRLSSRISILLEITIEANDSLPKHVCSRCRWRFENLERATADLMSFRSQASETAKSLCDKRPQKRSKECSGVIGISLDTLKSRPLPKRQFSKRQLNFGQCTYASLT